MIFYMHIMNRFYTFVKHTYPDPIQVSCPIRSVLSNTSVLSSPVDMVSDEVTGRPPPH